MNPLRAATLALAVLTLTAGAASAQSLQTSPYSLGYALPPGGGWALRGDASPGLKWALAESGRADYDSSRASVYADWFPFESSGFRLVGGVSFGELSAGLPAPSSLIGWAGVSASAYPARQKSPGTSTYVGIGYGQHGALGKGLGFYADMGVALGTLPGELESNGAGLTPIRLDGWRTQGSGTLGFRYLPSVSLGLIYRY